MIKTQATEKELEIRTLNIQEIEMREKQNGAKISGFAAVYGEFTELRDWFGDRFYERIDSNAVKKTLNDGHDIFALKNHNWDQLIGRTNTNLTLENRSDGLYFELTPSQTTLGKDILEEVRSGLISGCSIGFRVLDQDWEERDGDWFRTIKEIELLEITLTPIPAYTQTSAEVRSLTPNIAKKETQIDNQEQEERAALIAEANRILQNLKK
jgi:HK97 family phage prohead protease